MLYHINYHVTSKYNVNIQNVMMEISLQEVQITDGVTKNMNKILGLY